MDSAASNRDDPRDNGDVIEIIGGDELIYDGIQIQSPKSRNEPPIMETRNESMEIGNMFFNTQSFGSSRHNLYGDQCGFFHVHDDQSRIRETNSIILSPGIQSSVGYGDGGGIGNGNGGGIGNGNGGGIGNGNGGGIGNGNGGGIGNRNGGGIGNGNGGGIGNGNGGGIGNGNGGQVAAANATVRPANWRTKICNKWEQAGYCAFGSRCTFAHGAAELQRYGGGFVHQEATPNSQRLMSSNIVARPGSSMAHAVAPSGSSVARAGGSGQLPGSVGRPWKGPTKINRIYGDWIDDLE